jgi:hypothetical protein
MIGSSRAGEALKNASLKALSIAGMNSLGITQPLISDSNS